MRLGRIQKHTLRFYANYADKWHGYQTDRATRRVIRSLAERGLLTVNGFDQAKVTELGVWVASRH